MADRYLIESSGVDGYLLEDGSGVLLLETPTAIEDTDNWWAGAQKCFVGVAIATVLAATTLSTAIAQNVQQDREEIPAAYLQTSGATCTLKDAIGNSSNTTSYTSNSFTPAAGDVVIVFVVVSGNVDAAPTVADSNVFTTFTLVARVLKNSSADMVCCFVSNQPLNAVLRTVNFNCSPAATGAAISTFTISGLSKAGLAAIRQSASQANQAAAGTPAPAFTSACLTGNPVLGCVGNSSNPATMTPPASWTESVSPVADIGYNTPTTGSEVVSRNSGFTGTTVTWGSTSATAFADIIVELDASSFPAGEEDAIEPRVLKHTPFEPEITVWQ